MQSLAEHVCDLRTSSRDRRFTRHSALRARTFQSGFSFIEIMFAVILLGIGFIMLAAVFPVGIRQQQETLDADNATAVSNAAFSQLVSIFPATVNTPTAATNPAELNYVATDVAPVDGILFGAGGQRITVAVDVIEVAANRAAVPAV